jgi:hypothetical protein
LRNVGNFEVVKEEYRYKCDVSKGAGVLGGEVSTLQRNVHVTFLMDKIDM